MGATTGAGIAATIPVPVPKSCVYNTFTNVGQGGVMAGTVTSKGVGWFSPTSSGLSLLLRSGLLPFVETSLKGSPKILVPFTVAELLYTTPANIPDIRQVMRMIMVFCPGI